MSYPFVPQDNVFWYLKKNPSPRLRQDIKTDVVIVGGGVAGLSAAQNFASKGLSVVLLEQYYCGSGASGKSSGFITPDSEISLSDFVRKFDLEQAKKIWEFVTAGVKLIQNNVTQFSISCDYQVQDTAVLANSLGSVKELEEEDSTRHKLGYQSRLYYQDELKEIIGSSTYYGAIRYGGTFGINGYDYCQGMKDVLQQRGVRIFEETPVVKLHAQGVDTPGHTVKADHIIVCADRFIPDLGKLTQEIYHAQTFLMISRPLSDAQVRSIFPAQNLMVWDTDLIYTYYRVAGDNRLMVGGATLLYTYAAHEQHDSKLIINKLTNYIKTKFPSVSPVFEYIWPGLIGISKDLRPIAGFDKDMPNVYYVGACAGLPWAAALGAYSAERIVDNKTEYDTYFSPYRAFPIGGCVQSLLGKRIAFALSNFKTLKL